MKEFPTILLGYLQICKERLAHGYSQRYYSQDGIDVIIKTELSSEKNVFYVDVGANHPFWASNSYLLYRKGGRGINIDATPGLMKIFKLARPRDINLEVAISNTNKKMNYLIFNFAAYNGFEGTFDVDRIPHINLKRKIQIVPKKLSQVLDAHLQRNQKITVLLVDTEGHDMEVFKSNNWSKYRPKYIVTEYFTKSLKDIFSTEVYQYLRSKKYEVVACTQTNLLFKRAS